MQIDLFKDAEATKDMVRLLKQIETRVFRLNCDKDTVLAQCTEDTAFKEKMESIIDSPREYKSCYQCSYDSHFILEALGIGIDCKKYTVIVDLSDRLDYILHRLTGCPTAKVRALDNYSLISRSILNLDYDSLQSVRLGDIANIDESVASWLTQLLIDLNSETNLCDREKLDMLLLRFYRSIVQEANRIKNYVIMYIRHKFDNVIIRSKSVSSVIATTDAELDNVCILYDSDNPDFEECQITIHSLRPMEFYTGGVYRVFGWAYQN